MSITNATNFRKNAFSYLDRIVSSNDIVTVTTKGGNVVMLNEEEYNGLLETAYLCSIPGMAESIKEGLETPLDECVELDWENEL